tara:strand:- start:848 stop:1834 length:987 start_codon:yes stop_codon:yes gene_type:complete
MMNKISSITIIGYGSQAKTWASNLSDSGLNVRIALRSNSPSINLATNHGFQVLCFDDEEYSNDIHKSELIAILTPDHTHLEILNKVKGCISKDALIVFAHGFSVKKENLPSKFPFLNFGLLAPKAIASEMRELYIKREKFPGAISPEYCQNQQSSEEKLTELSKSLGMSPPSKVTFEEETVCDLFSEQSLLCSLLPYGIRYAFEALRQKNIHSEMAFNECLYESKLIIQTIEKLGFKKFFEIISPNALYGGQKAYASKEFQSLKSLFSRLIDDISNRKFFEEVDKTDFNKLRNNVIDDWSNSEINQAWERFHQQSREQSNEALDNKKA